MQWEVRGARKDDGSDAVIVVKADRRETAEGIAQLSGLLVESCEPSAMSPVLPYANARASRVPGMTLEVGHRTSRPWVVLMSVGGGLVATAAVVFLVGLFVGINGAGGPAVAPPTGNQIAVGLLLWFATFGALGLGALVFVVGLIAYAFRA